jgi:hypothetical protein
MTDEKKKTCRSPRPTCHTPAVQKAVVDALYPRLFFWGWRPNLGSIKNERQVREDLARILAPTDGWSISPAEDGQRLARRLEEMCGWRPDLELVEILDDVVDCWKFMTQKAAAKWVEKKGIVGPALLSSVQFAAQGEVLHGVVARNRRDGKSIVMIGERAEISSSLLTPAVNIPARLVNWEDLTVTVEGPVLVPLPDPDGVEEGFKRA